MKVEAARSLGISLKRFDGWEPKTFSHREKRDGRMVTIVEREPEWDEESQNWMLALAILERDTCSGCGGRLSETCDPEMEDKYVPDPPVRCHRCTALSVGFDQHREAIHSRALHFTASQRG